ncbi:hypothetical protein LCGC14_0129070 [marine sediment metagenome]|uniref:AAA+ ATPase domain-containing protein n=1 Tax=marine sediment metagenome TaxID=412755 RepID=A0A0F9V4G5_9ZZZZ|nr:ATP-binding protein [Maribacter sp.]HDZ06123.1 AAA family ATPase [Maribacter sp.]HEA80835.1 AAA family ATPase [Maribacter sp.]
MKEDEVILQNSILKQGVQVLLDQLTQYHGVLLEDRSPRDLKEIINTKFLKICHNYISIGQNEFELLDKDAGIIGVLPYLIHYKLPDHFKDIMLVHRDVLLQLQISKHKQLEGVVSLSSMDNHSLLSQKVLLEAVEYFIQKIKDEEVYTTALSTNKKGIDSKVKHLQNPWSIYANQFDIILKQFDTINANNPVIEQSISVFKELSKNTELITSQIITDSRTIINEIINSLSKIQQIEDKEDISLIMHALEKIEVKMDTSINHQESFTLIIEDISKNLSKTNVAVATEGGMLLEKRIDIGKAAKKWLDLNILPEVIALWDNKVELYAYGKHSILNLKGSLVVAKNQEKISSYISESQLFTSIEEVFNSSLKVQQELTANISKKMETEFLATSIYDQEEFLEVSLQSSLTHYTTDTNNFFTNWKRRFTGFFGDVNIAYDQVVGANINDTIDNATECIAHRMFKEENAQYDMLFLNKNFLGDHFLTERSNNELVFEKCLSHWEKGFHKSVLIVGDSQSGKSTFIKKVIKKSLYKDVLELVPESTITFQGRKFNTTKNLKNALQEIKKFSYNSKPIIVLDDLEFWHDKEHSFLDNIRAVIKFIESESDDILLVVSISKLMQEHLDHRICFSISFSTNINVSTSSNTEILNAVQLRHGASHRKLVDENNEIISPRQFQKLVYRLCKHFQNNLGNVLQAWTFGTSLTIDNKVVYKESALYFPDFFSNEEAILLKHVLLYKIIDERTVKTFLGKRYTNGYESGLKRLVNTKVLVREHKGFLSLNTVINSEIQKSLIYRGILK